VDKSIEITALTRQRVFPGTFANDVFEFELARLHREGITTLQAPFPQGDQMPSRFWFSDYFSPKQAIARTMSVYLSA
jgi:hypothetical protein